MQRTFQIAAFRRPMGVGRPLLVPLGVEPQSLGLMVQSCAQGPASKHCAFPTPPPPVTKRNDKASAQTKGIGLSSIRDTSGYGPWMPGEFWLFASSGPSLGQSLNFTSIYVHLQEWQSERCHPQAAVTVAGRLPGRDITRMPGRLWREPREPPGLKEEENI